MVYIMDIILFFVKTGALRAIVRLGLNFRDEYRHVYMILTGYLNEHGIYHGYYSLLCDSKKTTTAKQQKNINNQRIQFKFLPGNIRTLEK